MGNTACTEADTSYIGSHDELRVAHQLFLRDAGSATSLSCDSTCPSGSATPTGGGVSHSGFYHSIKAVVFSLDKRSGTVRVSTLPLSKDAAKAVAAAQSCPPAPVLATPRTGSARSAPSGTATSATRRPAGGLTPRHRTTMSDGASPPPSGGSRTPTGAAATTSAAGHASAPWAMVDETTAVVLLHVSRRLVGGAGSWEDPTAAEDAAMAGSVARGIFTPRGLSEPFSIDLGGLRWRAGQTAKGSEVYDATVYTMNGRRAHPLVLAAATTAAFDIERLTVHDTGFCRFLFHNGFPALRAANSNSSNGGGGTNAHLYPVDVNERCFTALQRSSMSSPKRPTDPVTGSSDLGAIAAHVHLLKTLFPAKSREGTDQLNTQHVSGLRSAPIGSTTPNRGAAVTPRPGTTTSSGGGRYTGTTSSQGALTARGPSRGSETTRSVDTAEDQNSSRLMNHSGGRAPPPKLALGGTKRPAAMPPIKLAIPGTGGGNLHPAHGTSRRPTHEVETDEDGVAVTGEYDDPQNERMARMRAAAPVATEVMPYLFVGGELPAADRSQLVAKRITHVVNCAHITLPNSHEDLLEYMAMCLSDSPDEPIFDLFSVCVGYIERAFQMGGKVFVHCHQGVSRSCSVVIAYAMWKHGLCYDAAYSMVREHRTVCSPNPGFMVNLLRWERRLRTPDPVSLFRFGPYSVEYATPFIFRDLQLFDALRPAHPNTTSANRTRSAETIAKEARVLDPRHVYLLVKACDEAPTAVLLVGDHAPSDIVNSAKEASRNLLYFGFYGNKPSFSEDRKGNKIQYNTSAVSRDLGGSNKAPPAHAFSAASGVHAIAELTAPYSDALRSAGVSALSAGEPLFTSVESAEALSAYHTPEMLDTFREAESARIAAQRKAVRRRLCRESVFSGRAMPTEFSDDDQPDPPRITRRTDDGSQAAAALAEARAADDARVDAQPTVRAKAIRTDSANSVVSSSTITPEPERTISPAPVAAPSSNKAVPPIPGGLGNLNSRRDTGNDNNSDHSFSDEHDDDGAAVTLDDSDLPEDRVVIFGGEMWGEQMEDLFDFDDLDPAAAYAVFARPRPSDDHQAAQLFLWIGSAFAGPNGDAEGEDADAIADLTMAVFDEVCADPESGLLHRLRHSSAFRGVDVTVVFEDAEPDDFVGAFE